jgi:hypothetical protein
MNRLYHLDVDDGIIAIVAKNIGEARMIGYSSDANMSWDFIDMCTVVSPVKDFDISKIQHLECGEVDDRIGLRMGMYTHLYDHLAEDPCEDCGLKDGDAYYHNEKILCVECYDKYFTNK